MKVGLLASRWVVWRRIRVIRWYVGRRIWVFEFGMEGRDELEILGERILDGGEMGVSVIERFEIVSLSGGISVITLVKRDGLLIMHFIACPWKLSFDGSWTRDSVGVGIVIEFLMGWKTQFHSSWDLIVPTTKLSKYNCNNINLASYCMVETQLLEGFDDVALQNIPRKLNYEANEMAREASGVYILENVKEMMINIKR
ncbi:hypothetical protein FNV43_RR00672 [Rhamnella rubrinervis]|uniref:Uncharacterized protein n=1 Tax=Rhamnella rubrinervis TaxID=2594499 RepID=A0A8K0HR42_9ROSA|nr:hypothetical protein FNV43_RR00672 [Rhamnella rubrinervis]